MISQAFKHCASIGESAVKDTTLPYDYENELTNAEHTEKGLNWINIAYSHNRYILTPLLSKSLQINIKCAGNSLARFKITQNHIKAGLNTIQLSNFINFIL